VLTQPPLAQEKIDVVVVGTGTRITPLGTASNSPHVMFSVGKTAADPLTQGAAASGVTSLNPVTGAPIGSANTVPSAF
jgi:hypothetical protein